MLYEKADYMNAWLQEIKNKTEIPEVKDEAEKLIARMVKLGSGEKLEKERADRTDRIESVPEAKISFFFAECREFPVLGEFHEDITLKEAVQYYNQIPAERLHGIKSIGFKLEDGTIYDGTYDLFCGGEILYDELDLVPHYRDSPLVQKAINELEQMIENGELNAKPIVRQALASKIEQEKIVEEVKSADISVAPEREATKEKSQSSQDKKSGSRESVLKALRERQARLKEQEKSNSHNNTKEHKKGDISL